MNNIIKFIFPLILFSVVLSGCDIVNNDLLDKIRWKSKVDIKSEKLEDVNIPLYGDILQGMAVEQLTETEVRFQDKINIYQGIVDELWETKGFYKNQDLNLSPQEHLIDFYLFMEYHKDTQIRNLNFPSVIRDELLIVETLFVGKALKHLESIEVGENYEVLKNDLLTHYRNMYREELINELYEGLNQLDLSVRIPGIIERYNSEFENKGLRERIKLQLGIPDSVISRGMGLDLVTLYGGTGDYTPEDIDKLAVVLSLEMQLSGANMKLEQFFKVTSSIDGLGSEIELLKKDIEFLNLTGELSWVKERMLRCITYLDSIHQFYSGSTNNVKIEDIFIELQIREDFYALGLLSVNLKEVMDNENYWEELSIINSTRTGQKEKINPY